MPYRFRFIDDLLDLLGVGRFMRRFRESKTWLLAGKHDSLVSLCGSFYYRTCWTGTVSAFACPRSEEARAFCWPVNWLRKFARFRSSAWSSASRSKGAAGSIIAQGRRNRVYACFIGTRSAHHCPTQRVSARSYMYIRSFAFLQWSVGPGGDNLKWVLIPPPPLGVCLFCFICAGLGLVRGAGMHISYAGMNLEMNLR